MRIGILGGGIAGLACAHYLLEAGHHCVVVDGASGFGGLASQFEFKGTRIDRFHKPLLPVDSALCGLIADLGGLDELLWRQVSTGVVNAGRLERFDRPRDVWRLSGLDRASRARMIAITAFLTRMPGYGMRLDRVPASLWLRRWLGRATYEQVWAPTLRARFGEYVDEAPAYWVWTLLQRYRHRAGGVRGYPRGGYRSLVERLSDSIRERGGEVLFERPALGIDWNAGRAVVEFEDASAVFDAVVSTLPLPEFAKIASAPLLRQIPFAELPHVGSVSAAVVSREPISPVYSAVVIRDEMPFHSLESASAIVPASSTGGHAVTYLKRSCEAHTEGYLESDEQVARGAFEMIERLFPSFDTGSIEHVEVSRAPQVEPVWTVGSLGRRPPTELADARVLLCTTAHAYPRMPSWDTSVTLARESVQRLID